MTLSNCFLNFLKIKLKRILSLKFLLKCIVYGPLVTICAFLAFWLYLSTDSIPNLVDLDEAAKYSYDYIIVGGGTAGCILASRLSENADISVLLIEAGSTFSPFAMIPFLTSQQQRTQNDWKLETTSQKYSSFGFADQVQFLPRGKGIGGSSQLNYLLHFDGHRNDFDRWVENGADLWTINDEVDLTNAKHFKNGCTAEHSCSDSDTITTDTKSQNLLRTRLRTTPITYDYSQLASTFIDASAELCHRNSSDFEYHLAKYNTHKGLRHSVYHAYLKPAFRRQNLKILLSTRVHRIILKQKNAVGVWVTEDNFKRTPLKIHAAREVIVSAGAFHTPQILKLSGIGPAKELKRFNIKVIHNAPMIGRNLYDHSSMPLYVSVNESITVTRSKVLSVWEVLNYFLHGDGLFSNFGVLGYLNDRNADFGSGIFGVGSIDERILRRIVNTDREVFRQNFPFYNDSKQDGFVLLNTCYQPLSRGIVGLASNRIQDSPLIDPNYLESQADVDCIIRAIRMAMSLISTDSFKAVNAKIHWPKFLNFCRNFLPNDEIDVTDQYLECIIRVGALTAHHPGGSCAIGKSSNSALDNQMRVRGVRRLRVIDASAIPAPVSGTPHTAIAAIAEWASHIILYSS